MTPDENRRLELARRAWDAERAREDDGDLAVRRLSRRLSARRRSRDPARRVVGMGAALIAFGAAVAYASSGGFAIPFVELRAPAPPPAEPFVSTPEPARGAHGLAAPPAEREPEAEPEPEPEAKPALVEGETEAKSEPKSASTPRAPRARRAARLAPAAPQAASEATPPTQAAPAQAPATPSEPASEAPVAGAEGAEAPAAPGASWAEVSRALAERDDAAARRALQSLGGSSDPATRAKAKLGLAQLAASRGDCDRARALARAVAESSEADARTAARARSLARRCVPGPKR